MDELFACLENHDDSALFRIKSNEKSPQRSWTGLHYACCFRNIPGILSILSCKPIDSLVSCDILEKRPCDLLPLPELSLFSLYSWGVGSDYQLGFPKDKQQIAKKVEFSSPRQPSESILQFASYKYHTLAVTESKNLWAFGNGRKGVLGNGSELSAICPIKIPLKNVIQVAVGEMHSVCLTEERNVFAWGDNSLGQIPNCKAPYVSRPLYIKFFKTIYIEKIVAGKNHSAALSSQSKTFLWGDNSTLQLFGRLEGINTCIGTDLVHSPNTIIDIEAYENSTAILLQSGLVVKSSLNGVQRFHVACNCEVIKVCISSCSIHALSVLGVLYSFPFSALGSNLNYKMLLTLEGISKVFSGFHAAAVDKNCNLWRITDKTFELIKEISCVSQACITQFYSMALLGAEKVAFVRSQGVLPLFDMCQEKVLETVNIHTACELLLFSDIFGCNRLREYCEYFISRNLRSYATLSNFEYLLLLPLNFADGLQKNIAPGSLPPLPEPQAKTSSLNKKQKKKKRAMSELEQNAFPVTQKKEQNRSRAQTESQIVVPKQFIPPPQSKNKPWGDLHDIRVGGFNEVQKEETREPMKINKWVRNNAEDLADFEKVQDEEKEGNEIYEALLQIAMMESMNK